MSRTYRVQDRTRNKLADLNKRVSNKKSRYRREKGIELNPIISTKKASDFGSRKELEKYVRQMEKFLKRDTQFVQNKSGAIFDTKVAKRHENFLKRVTAIQEKEKSRVIKLPTQMKGTKLGMTVGDRMKIGAPTLFRNLQKLSGGLDRFKSQKELEKLLATRFEGGYFRGDFLRRANLQYKANYIQSLETEFGSKSANLRAKIERMSLNDFMDVHYQTLGGLAIDYIYRDNENEDARLNILEQTFAFKNTIETEK